MKEMPKSVEEETLAVEKETTQCDGDFEEIAATVKRGEKDKTV